MSLPPGPEGSALEPVFVVGPDLVEFHRPDMPIYAAPESRWADAGLDIPAYGAPLDRLFGEAEPVFVSGPFADAPLPDSLPTMEVTGDIGGGGDSLVMIDSLSDGASLPDLGPASASPSHEVATIFEAGAESFAAVHLLLDAPWDGAGDFWSFDYGT